MKELLTVLFWIHSYMHVAHMITTLTIPVYVVGKGDSFHGNLIDRQKFLKDKQTPLALPILQCSFRCT